MYLTAPEGMAGRFSPVKPASDNMKEELLSGQVLALPLEEYPPSPLGALLEASALCRAVKSDLVVMELPLMVTRP